jgi:hypothetical protein
MSKNIKKENSILKIFNSIAAKRFSKKEKIGLIIAAVIFSLIGNHFIQAWIDAQKNTTTVITPLIPKDKLELPKPVYKKTEDQKEVVDNKPIKPAIRDPFLSSKNPDKMKKVTKKKPQIDLKLSGVLWDDQIPTAIINSKVVKIGDLIQGKTVVDIEKDQVLLMEEGQIYVLKLRKQ